MILLFGNLADAIGKIQSLPKIWKLVGSLQPLPLDNLPAGA